MNMLQQLASQTPIWVWLLLAFLVTGIAAMKPAQTSLQKLAIVPGLFAVWCVVDQPSFRRVADRLERVAGRHRHGAALAWLLLSRLKLTLDRSTGKLWRSADFSCCRCCWSPSW